MRPVEKKAARRSTLVERNALMRVSSNGIFQVQLTQTTLVGGQMVSRNVIGKGRWCDTQADARTAAYLLVDKADMTEEERTLWTKSIDAMKDIPGAC